MPSIQEPASGSPYQEGGALYALGMIHANHGAAIIPYLSEQLQTATNEVSLIILRRPDADALMYREMFLIVVKPSSKFPKFRNKFVQSWATILIFLKAKIWLEARFVPG